MGDDAPKIAFPLGYPGPHLIHGYLLGSTRVPTSIGSSVFVGLVVMTDRHTHTDHL